MPRVVLFDFNGTLFHGDAFKLFVRERYRRVRWLVLPAILSLPLLLPMLIARRGRHAAARWLVRLVLFGVSQRRYQQLAEEFGRALARDTRLFSHLGIAALRQYLGKGEHVLIVTACEETLTRAILDELGLGTIQLVASVLGAGRLGMRVRVQNIGLEKAHQLARLGIRPPWDIAISDSLVDLSILAAAREAILVNPDRRMLKRASARLGKRLTVAEWD
ncbi:MAG: haloacid dehalogenase-like hydrolase [Rhodanobacteraceae bacterium]